MKMTFKYTLVILLIAWSSSCMDRDEEKTRIREQLIAEGVKIKITEFRQREWQTCLERARADAVIEVDSLIRAMAKQDAIEPVAKPPKPERPVKPETKVLPDSLIKKTGREEPGQG